MEGAAIQTGPVPVAAGNLAGEAFGHGLKLLRSGGLGRLAGIIRFVRALSPKNDDPFPVWQGMQYLYCMFEGSGALSRLDNNRYPGIPWTGINEVFKPLNN